MILVESIKYFEVPEDFHKIIHKVSAYEGIEVFTKDGLHVVSTNLVHELVSGRRFRRPSDGVEICIGWSQEVQDLLGMPLDAWENMEVDRAELARSEREILKELHDIKHANFWQRFKWLFKGVT